MIIVKIIMDSFFNKPDDDLTIRMMLTTNVDAGNNIDVDHRCDHIDDIVHHMDSIDHINYNEHF